MDLFHDNPMFQAARQMLGAFAKQEMRPIAPKHDLEETMPWELMKKAQMFGLTQTALIDAQKTLGGEYDKPVDGKKKPRKSNRVAVVGAEELAWGCAGIGLALAGSGLAAAPIARMGT
jgi:acyl-CoA dehydrogenase